MLELLILIIFMCIILAAYINIRYYRNRQSILKELYDWLLAYKDYVIYQHLAYNDIVSKTRQLMSPSLRKMTTTPIIYDNMSIALDNKTKNEILSILTQFGKCDIDSEKEYIDMCVSKVDKMCIKSADDYKSKGILRSKLIIVFGLAFLILLI